MGDVSQVHNHLEQVAGQAPNLDELARIPHAEPVVAEELASDIWESDEELDAFLDDLRATRNASIA